VSLIGALRRPFQYPGLEPLRSAFPLAHTRFCPDKLEIISLIGTDYSTSQTTVPDVRDPSPMHWNWPPATISAVRPSVVSAIRPGWCSAGRCSSIQASHSPDPGSRHQTAVRGRHLPFVPWGGVWAESALTPNKTASKTDPVEMKRRILLRRR